MYRLIRDQLKQIFEKMYYVQSEDEYNYFNIWNQKHQNQSLNRYFIKNWHHIISQ